MRDATSRTSTTCERSMSSTARVIAGFLDPSTLQLALLIPYSDPATSINRDQGGRGVRGLSHLARLLSSFSYSTDAERAAAKQQQLCCS